MEPDKNKIPESLPFNRYTDGIFSDTGSQNTAHPDEDYEKYEAARNDKFDNIMIPPPTLL